MQEAFALNFINLFVFAFNILLLIRVFMSFFNVDTQHGFGGFIHDVTEPVLAPIRRLLPQGQMLDFSPLIVFLLLQLLSSFANNLLG